MRSFAEWAASLRERLDTVGADGNRIPALVDGYFGFAREHPHLWTAILDHRLPPDGGLTEGDETDRALLTRIVVEEIAPAIGCEINDDVAALSRSLIATVHGHCAFAISGPGP